jgi:hypothetical protein
MVRDCGWRSCMVMAIPADELGQASIQMNVAFADRKSLMYASIARGHAEAIVGGRKASRS